jgi:hypothetical protein
MLTLVHSTERRGTIAMAQAHSETYRERYTARYEHTDAGSRPASEAEDALSQAIRDARETVNRLLGGWHEAYAQGVA